MSQFNTDLAAGDDWFAHRRFPPGSAIGYYPMGIMAEYADLCTSATGWQFKGLPYVGRASKEVAAFAGWGRRTVIANWGARFHRRPLISIEDGFFRSLRLGLDGDRPLSLVADTTGVYYDARSPSDLERLLEDGGWETPALIRRAEAGIAAVRRSRLSKYNDAPDMDAHELEVPPRSPGQKRILVVDQTRNDMSIVGGLAKSETFQQMLVAAVTENPGAQVLVKVHPSVVSGKRRGHLIESAARSGCTLIGAKVNIWSVLDLVDEVYVVTSQVGFEAAMAGLPVHCFGMPFYAGWGITIDRQSLTRRTRKRTTAEVFAAACLVYSRYLDPYSLRLTTFETFIDALSSMLASHRDSEGFTRAKPSAA